MYKRVWIAGLIVSLGLQVSAKKEVYIPNDFKNDPVMKQWSWEKSYQSENFVIFWGDEIDGDPRTFSDEKLRFDPEMVCNILEECYSKYIGEIGFLKDTAGNNLATYKIIIAMNETWTGGGPTGWAFGGAYDEKIGAMWVHPGATRDGGVISHEFAHSLQNMTKILEGGGSGYQGYEPAGWFWESHANFMRCQMYPNMAGDDMPRWMATAHFQLSSTRHHYSAYRWLMHLQNTDGIEMVNRLWRESIKDEHPLETLRRLKGWNQDELNDFIYDYAIREVTFDYPANGFGEDIRNQYESYRLNEPHNLWRRYAMLEAVGKNPVHYRVPDEFAPQDYGYNIIPLYPTSHKRTVRIKFKGYTGINGNEGWRYGFVAVNQKGEPRYSECVSAKEMVITAQIKPDDQQLYLVVVGAPGKHHSYVWEPGWPKITRFPYEILVDGAVPEGYQKDFRAEFQKDGHRHKNGKGWVADTADVADSVYVGPKAMVRGNSKITDDVRIEGTAWVEDAQVCDRVVIGGHANVFGGRYSGDAVVTDNAVLNHCAVSGNALIKDNALAWQASYEGSVVVGGDAENGKVSSGVYLQVPHPNNGRTPGDDKEAEDESNQDINKPRV